MNMPQRIYHELMINPNSVFIKLDEFRYGKVYIRMLDDIVVIWDTYNDVCYYFCDAPSMIKRAVVEAFADFVGG